MVPPELMNTQLLLCRSKNLMHCMQDGSRHMPAVVPEVGWDLKRTVNNDIDLNNETLM